MRPIDADALKLEGYAEEGTGEGIVRVQDIDEAPTLDVAPVVHGRWIDKPTGAYKRMQSWCTACGKHSGIGGIETNRHKPYCPNCGAKMDKEDKTDD